MEVTVEPGRYVVAVSGGMDSVVLLDLLKHKIQLSEVRPLQVVVAHFDHGIRPDSAGDRQFVAGLARQHGLPFEHAEGKLGPNASEATAREARYAFLRGVMIKRGAKAIVTAHHQDDLVETAIINLLRGTGRKGLTSLRSQGDIVRPLLGFSKQQLLEYARANKLQWREDSTNQDEKYLRNYVRHQLLPKLDSAGKQQLLAIINSQQGINDALDSLLADGYNLGAGTLDRQWLVSLPHDMAREAMASWLRANGVGEFDRLAIERAVVGAKTARPGKKIVVKKGWFIQVEKSKLALVGQER